MKGLFTTALALAISLPLVYAVPVEGQHPSTNTNAACSLGIQIPTTRGISTCSFLLLGSMVVSSFGRPMYRVRTLTSAYSAPTNKRDIDAGFRVGAGAGYGREQFWTVNTGASTDQCVFSGDRCRLEPHGLGESVSLCDVLAHGRLTS